MCIHTNMTFLLEKNWYVIPLSIFCIIFKVSIVISGLETFIQEYVDSKNREIEDHNDKVRKNAGQFVDLFAWDLKDCGCCVHYWS